MAKRMSEKAYTVDDFIKRVRSHPAFQTGVWVRRADDLEAVLRYLFASDDERAIEMSDQIREVIECKHVSVERRIAMIQQILHAGRIHVGVRLSNLLTAAIVERVF
jgi:hypothetical protein